MSRYFVTSARGVEAITAKELETIGAVKTEPVRGGVYFEGDQDTLYKAHLWLRTGNRILLPLRNFSCRSISDFYENIKKFRWETFLDEKTTFAVDCTISGRNSPDLQHSHFAKLKAKDAICDRLREKTGKRPDVDVEKPDIPVVIYLRDGECTINMDATGGSLHERGYRHKDAPAPLKETLAAALIEHTGWNGSTPFVDPMCGSGTLVIEAVLKAANLAPGLLRRRFAFQNWPDYYEPRWNKWKEEALKSLRKVPDGLVMGFDRDPKMLRLAQSAAGHARISEGKIRFEQRAFEDFALPEGTPPGVLLVNPPYGERLGEEEELKALYKLMGDSFKQKLKGWNCFVFTGNLELAKHIGLKASRRIELFNGAIDCRLLKYEMY